MFAKNVWQCLQNKITKQCLVNSASDDPTRNGIVVMAESIQAGSIKRQSRAQYDSRAIWNPYYGCNPFCSIILPVENTLAFRWFTGGEGKRRITSIPFIATANFAREKEKYFFFGFPGSLTEWSSQGNRLAIYWSCLDSKLWSQTWAWSLLAPDAGEIRLKIERIWCQ